MELKIGKCPVCGVNHTLIPSNNKLVAPTCISCVIEQLNYNDAIDANYFCRTYDIPFEPEL